MTARRAVLALALALALVRPAAPDAVADFYKGRTIFLLIPVGVGASYDIEARLIGRTLGDHIPGRPAIVPQNMVGGGGTLMTNYLFAAAPRDGTYLGMMPNTIVMNQMTGGPGVRYDAGRLRWIGSALGDTPAAMAVMARAGVASIAEAREKSITAGSTARGSFLYTMPTLLNLYLGTRFRIVGGYDGLNQVYLAMERGEVDASGVTWSEFRAEKPDLLASGRVRIIVQSLPRAKDLPDVPTIDSLARSDHDRRVIGFLLSGNRLGRPVAAPPGTPDAIVAALREAFEATMRDQRFRDAAASLRIEVEPIPGASIEKTVDEILRTPPAVVAEARKILE